MYREKEKKGCYWQNETTTNSSHFFTSLSQTQSTNNWVFSTIDIVHYIKTSIKIHI